MGRIKTLNIIMVSIVGGTINVPNIIILWLVYVGEFSVGRIYTPIMWL